MEESFSTGQSPQWAVVPVEEEEEKRGREFDLSYLQWVLWVCTMMCEHNNKQSVSSKDHKCFD
jgi:hypothetical protein